MRDETRFGLILWIILLMMGTCGGLEQNTINFTQFFIIVIIELVVMLALLPHKKKQKQHIKRIINTNHWIVDIIDNRCIRITRFDNYHYQWHKTIYYKRR